MEQRRRILFIKSILRVAQPRKVSGFQTKERNAKFSPSASFVALSGWAAIGRPVEEPLAYKLKILWLGPFGGEESVHGTFSGQWNFFRSMPVYMLATMSL
jgi:hypothetical protein